MYNSVVGEIMSRIGGLTSLDLLNYSLPQLLLLDGMVLSSYVRLLVKPSKQSLELCSDKVQVARQLHRVGSPWQAHNISIAVKLNRTLKLILH